MDDERLPRLRMLTPLRRRSDLASKRVRRGVYLLPSLFTMGNMFCGYCCIVYAIRGEFATAAPFIGFAMVLDMLDGRVARMTGATSDFGIEFDSLADVISFGMAPALLSFMWGLQPLGRIGWAASFLFVAAAAVRLARFNIQSGSQDKRYFVGMPSPAAAAVPAATVFAYPVGFQYPAHAVAVLAMVVVPAHADGEHHPVPQLQDVRSAVPPELSGPDPLRAGAGGARGAARDPAGRPGLRLPRLGVRRSGADSLPAASAAGRNARRERSIEKQQAL